MDRVARAKLSDPYRGCRVRSWLEHAGLTEIENEGVSHIVRGGEARARLHCMTLQAFMERGILSQAEYAELQLHHVDGICGMGEARPLTIALHRIAARLRFCIS